MNLFFKILLGLAGLVVAAGILVLIAGQLGYLKGTAPTDLGVRDDRLKPPSQTANSVSSQANLYPDHPQREAAQIEPFKYSGDGAVAMARLARMIERQPSMFVVFHNEDYLRAEASTPVLGFTDDLEFWLDPARGVVQLRSASRLGRRDFGTNRERIESLRAAFGG